MVKPKGGRGKKAPYKTQQMRVPIPIKDQVNELIAKFRGEIPNESNLSNDILAPQESDEIQKLKAALQDANQQRDNLQIEIQKLSASLEETHQNIGKLKTGKNSDFVVGAIIGESDALQHYGIGRQTLRRPREKDKKIVTFKSNNTLITLEYAGQPDGKGKPHFWKINDIEETSVDSKISQLDLYSC